MIAFSELVIRSWFRTYSWSPLMQQKKNYLTQRQALRWNRLGIRNRGACEAYKYRSWYPGRTSFKFIESSLKWPQMVSNGLK